MGELCIGLLVAAGVLLAALAGLAWIGNTIFFVSIEDDEL